MFNMGGEVIGINTAIFSPTGGSVGIGFAIPATAAKPVIDQLIKHGQVRRGWLGVHIQAVTDEIAETLGLKEAAGALVASVIKEGPAEKARIEAGDVILDFDGKKVTEMRRLPRMVADTEVGKEVPVTVWRNNKKVALKAKVGELTESVTEVAAKSGNTKKGGAEETNVESLGLRLSSITPKVAEQFKLGKDAKGVIVLKVDEKGPAAEKGIRAGDLIVEVSQEEVRAPGDIAKKVADARKAGRKSVLLLLEGQGGLRFVAIRIDKG